MRVIHVCHNIAIIKKSPEKPYGFLLADSVQHAILCCQTVLHIMESVASLKVVLAPLPFSMTNDFISNTMKRRANRCGANYASHIPGKCLSASIMQIS